MTPRLLAAVLLAAVPARAQTTGGTPASPVPNSPAPNGPATTAPAPNAPAANVWLPRGSFDLMALDKVSARTTTLSGKVGDRVTYGSLTITVRACLVRPPDQAPDATALLDIVDSRPNSPGFHGWMLLSAPSLSMLEHPVYDIRLAGCRA